MKWEVHIEGPDDVLTFDSEVEAYRCAKAINAVSEWAQRGVPKEDRVVCRAKIRIVADDLLSGRGEADPVAERAAVLDRQWQKQIDIRRGEKPLPAPPTGARRGG